MSGAQGYIDTYSTHATEVSDSARSHHGNNHGDFLMRVGKGAFKKLQTELRSILTEGIFCIKMILLAILGFIIFLFGFPLTVVAVGIIFPPIIVYFLGKYFTLLPMYIVMVLVILTLFPSKKAVFPFLGLAIFLSFFVVFLV